MSSPASDLPRHIPDIVMPSFGGYIAEEGALSGVSFGPRAVARIIDILVQYVVAYLTGRLFGLMLRIAAGTHLPPMVIWHLRHPGIPGFIFALLGTLSYHVIFTSVYGASIGKRLLSMVVVQEDGTPCSIRSALIRELSYYYRCAILRNHCLHVDAKVRAGTTAW